MKTKFDISDVINASPETIYNAWLDSELHSAMTGGIAFCSKEKNNVFTAWDGYITGKNLDLVSNELIIQAWRTFEFDDTDEDSFLQIKFTAVDEETEIKISHSNIPNGNADYKSGWVEHYFNPMKTFFK